MTKQRLVPNLMISLMLIFQVSGAGAVFADTAPATTAVAPVTTTTPTAPTTPVVAPAPATTTTPTTTVTPAATATPATTPAPIVADPAPKIATPIVAAPVVAATTPVAPATDAAKTTIGAPAKTGAPTTTGAPSCGGFIPDWVYDTTIPKWVAADKSSFQCDMTSGYFLSTKYYYDKQNGWYEIIPASTAKPDYMITAPNVVHTMLGDLVVGSKDYQIASALGLLNTTNGIMMTNPGNSSVMASGQAGTNSPSTNPGTNPNWFDMTSLVNVMSALQSSAKSGNVAASSNTQVGNAVTGAATVIANLINLLSSAWSWSNGGLNFFMSNLFGNHTGDINLSLAPASGGSGGALGSTASVNGPTGAASTNQAGINNNGGLTVNGQTNGNIVNNVDVTAKSGSAAVSQNTLAGNVQTGNATAMVNIINLINSYISSGSSFFGILNIFGNLNGDILFPNGFLNGALANGSNGATTASVGGTGPGSNNQATVTSNSPTTTNNTVANRVNNNILTSANSGSANVSGNTAAGNVSTGSAQTNQSLFNLSNTSLFSDNAVLVIVNVLGHWVGKIMNLPGANSSQSALLTSNAQTAPTPANTATVSGGTGADSTNLAKIDNSQPTAVNLRTSGTITNNVNVDAQSGNAAATQNTAVGDVSTGNAKAASSVANIFNTVLNVKHWFGVLIVNVFGSWVGDVNNNTSAGDQPASATAAIAAASNPKLLVTAMANLRPGRVTTSQTSGSFGGSSSSDQGSGSDGSVLAASTITPPLTNAAAHLTAATVATQASTQANNSNLLFMIAAALLLMAGALSSIERRLRRA